MKIVRSKVEDKKIIQNLYQLYLHDLSEFEEIEIDDNGLYPLGKYFDLYWTEAERIPFLMFLNESIVGFCFVRILGVSSYQLSEFFILRSFRNQGIAKEFAFQIFNMYRGQWQVCQLKNNVPARRFWIKVVSQFTNGQFIEQESVSEPVGYMQLFNNLAQ
jgi:predicted acetyltransferase